MALTLPTPDPEFPPDAALVSLARLEPGDAAIVVRVDTSRPIGRRLFDLGFAPGTLVRALRRAPLGDPASFELRGTRVCLRRAEIPWIQVSRCPDPPPHR